MTSGQESVTLRVLAALPSTRPLERDVYLADPTRRCAAARRRVAIAIGATVGVWGCSGDGDVAAIPTSVAERGSIERIVVASGTIEPVVDLDIRPRIAGIVEKIRVEPGDSVEQGDPLVEIERELLASQVREAKALLSEARVERRYAKLDLERARELESSGAVSNQQGDTARARFEGAEAAVARAQAILDRLSTELSYATVRSPMNGRILDVYIEEGSAVSPVTSVTGGTILLSLAATETLHLEGLVDENEIARVVEGQEARIRTEAFEDRIFRGHVRDIAPLGQRIQNVTYFEVEIEVTDPDAGLLRPRMSGDGEIVTEVIEDAVVIPIVEGEHHRPDYYLPAHRPKVIPEVFDAVDVAEWFGLETDTYRFQAVTYILRAGRKPGQSLAKDLAKAMECLQRRLSLEVRRSEPALVFNPHRPPEPEG